MSNKKYTIKDIDLSGKYEGYFWMSDRKKPDCFAKDKSLAEYLGESKIDLSKQNPFVVEGLICDGHNSFSIRFVGGETSVSIVPLSTLREDDQMDYISLLGNGIPYKLRFVRNWQPEKDENCCGWNTLKPKGLVFVGFEK